MSTALVLERPAERIDESRVLAAVRSAFDDGVALVEEPS